MTRPPDQAGLDFGDTAPVPDDTLPSIGRKVTQLASHRRDKFQRLWEEAEAIHRESAASIGQVGYINRTLVQATLPHAEPKGNPPVWGRHAGAYSLVIQPGMYLRQETVVDTRGRTSTVEVPTSVGYPYGSKPRLILAWLGREVKAKREPVIQLGRSLSDFMSQIGIDSSTGGKTGSITYLREQMRRLFSARIMLTEDPKAGSRAFDQSYMQIAERQRLWWDTEGEDGPGRGPSMVRLNESFYRDMLDNGVPLDMRALKALKQSPLELDVYSWLTYRMVSVHTRTVVPWEALMLQFGTGTQNPRKFRFMLRRAMRSVLTVYSEARIDVDHDTGLVLLPSPTSVPKVRSIR